MLEHELDLDLLVPPGLMAVNLLADMFIFADRLKKYRDIFCVRLLTNLKVFIQQAFFILDLCH